MALVSLVVDCDRDVTVVGGGFVSFGGLFGVAAVSLLGVETLVEEIENVKGN